MKRALIVFSVLVAVSGCELNITNPSPTVSSTPAPTTVSVTNTNTNTSTSDRSDTGAPASPSGGGSDPTTPGQPLPLPTYGESVTRAVAASNPSLLANSCQETSGESAWQFLDLVIRTLRAQDQRWGYLCKDGSCVTFARDVVAYRASSTNLGIWIVDVIGNHCPGPTDPPPAVRWGVLPFETARPWSATRTAGGF